MILEKILLKERLIGDRSEKKFLSLRSIESLLEDGLQDSLVCNIVQASR